MKVSELSGALLDLWVARAEGLPLSCDWDQGEYILVGTGAGDLIEFSPSSNWSEGGPIIERERVHLEPFPGGEEYPEWMAFEQSDGWGEPVEDSPRRQYGETALEAAMRAYVASKFGEEVPDIDQTETPPP